MRGNGARECRTSRISPKNSTLESRGDEGQKARECSKPRIAPKNATLESARRGAGGLAEGLWPLSNYSALARAGGLCIP